MGFSATTPAKKNAGILIPALIKIIAAFVWICDLSFAYLLSPHRIVKTFFFQQIFVLTLLDNMSLF